MINLRFFSMSSSSFANTVRSVVAAIPPGTTRTYKEVATEAGNPNAARAVGAIMRRNTDPAIPCHRVVASDGTLGGYNGGIDKKKALLKQEGVL